MKSLRFLIVIPVLLLAIVMASTPVLASTTQSAQFGATAVGPCVVGIGPLSGDVNYLETARGTFSFQGNAKVTPEQLDSLNLYAVEAGSLKAHGALTATWSHDGQSYKFIASIYSTDSSEGCWVDPTNKWIIFGGTGGGYGCPLEYKGVLTTGRERTSYQGLCGLMVVNGSAIGYEDIPVVVTKFIVGDKSINVFWAKEAMSLDLGGGVNIDIPAAQVVLDHVMLIGR